MTKINREELRKRAHEQELQRKEEFANLKAEAFKDVLRDEDGYPTEKALELISKWHWSEFAQLMDFVESIWYLKSWGWTKKREENPLSNDKELLTRYYVSTAGWSGNEAIIRALEKNEMFWDNHWVQSNRGGHYIFELKDED